MFTCNSRPPRQDCTRGDGCHRSAPAQKAHSPLPSTSSHDSNLLEAHTEDKRPYAEFYSPPFAEIGCLENAGLRTLSRLVTVSLVGCEHTRGCPFARPSHPQNTQPGLRSYTTVYRRVAVLLLPYISPALRHASVRRSNLRCLP